MFAFLRSRPAALLGSEANGPTVADTALLDTLADAHDAARDEADASFTPERAAAQRAAILARLGATVDPRVLSFPLRTLEASQPVRRAASPRPALGWMLTAAAAGLVVGVGTGQGLYDDWQPGRQAVSQSAIGSGRVISAPVAVQPAVTDLDDAILGEVELALAARGVDELQPLDALTPRVTLVASR
jgi:hypothetical protein